MPISSHTGKEDNRSWLRTDYLYDSALNIWKPKANKGEFGYSDGDESENYVFSTVQSAKDCSVMSDELAGAMKDWPSTYHLHQQRCNLVRPIAMCLKGPILEVGAGCGAITRFLGELGEQVFALEGSPRRSSIIGARCADLANVQVINANLQDLNTDEKFKTITLVGVLEYARVYFSDGSDIDPVDQMLRYLSNMLTPDGVLVIAIENQIGLKYFAGYPEDHLGIPMAGVEGRYHDNSVVTFGREELSKKIAAAGLPNQNFAYPFPDYKLPQTVLFERAMSAPYSEQLAALVAGANASDRQKPLHQNFLMSGVLSTIMRNGLGGELANSFLIMASKSSTAQPVAENVLAVYYGNGDRKMSI